jgi:large subunit ribosomal protein L17
MRNLAAALIIHRRIRTTDAKAKELRSFVEPLVTFAKQGTLHARRQVLKALPGQSGREVTHILFHELAPSFADRPGGYTRIIKLGNRTNDRAPVSLIEFVDAAPAPDSPDAEGGDQEAGKSKKRGRKKKADAAEE